MQWRVEVSYIEIYNQQVRDLLKKPKKFMGVTMSRQNLKIRNNKGYAASLQSPPPPPQQQHANTDTYYVDKSVSIISKVQRKVWRRCCNYKRITKLNSGSSQQYFYRETVS